MQPASSTRERVAAIVRVVFGAPGLQVTDQLSPDDVPEWDSLKHIDLVIALEGEFGFQLLGSEIAEIKSVGALFSVLARYGVT